MRGLGEAREHRGFHKSLPTPAADRHHQQRRAPDERQLPDDRGDDERGIDQRDGRPPAPPDLGKRPEHRRHQAEEAQHDPERHDPVAEQGMEQGGGEPGEEAVRERERLPVADHRHVEGHAVAAPEAVAHPPDVSVVADRVVGDEHLLAQDQRQHHRPEDGDDRRYDLAGLRRALLLDGARRRPRRPKPEAPCAERPLQFPTPPDAPPDAPAAQTEER